MTDIYSLKTIHQHIWEFRVEYLHKFNQVANEEKIMEFLCFNFKQSERTMREALQKYGGITNLKALSPSQVETQFGEEYYTLYRFGVEAPLKRFPQYRNSRTTVPYYGNYLHQGMNIPSYDYYPRQKMRTYPDDYNYLHQGMKTPSYDYYPRQKMRTYPDDYNYTHQGMEAPSYDYYPLQEIYQPYGGYPQTQRKISPNDYFENMDPQVPQNTTLNNKKETTEFEIGEKIPPQKRKREDDNEGEVVQNKKARTDNFSQLTGSPVPFFQSKDTDLVKDEEKMDKLLSFNKNEDHINNNFLPEQSKETQLEFDNNNLLLDLPYEDSNEEDKYLDFLNF